MNDKHSLEKTQYLLTCLVANSIRHVKKFFFTRLQKPSMAEQVGEFVTEIRRHLKTESLNKCGFKDLTNTDMWSNVGVPKENYAWNFTYYTIEGIHKMNHLHAQTLCENATRMANNDKTIDEEFLEINSTLNNIMRETTTLDSLIYRAKELNSQADIVVSNLCTIAENLSKE